MPPDRPLCTAIDRHAGVAARPAGTRAPICGAAGSWSSRYQPLGRVRVHLPRAQVVGGGDLGHRRQRGVERARRRGRRGPGSAPGRRRTARRPAPCPAPWRRSTAGRRRRRPGTAEITATAGVAPGRARGRASTRREKQSIGSSSPHAACGKPDAPLARLEEVGLHVDDDVSRRAAVVGVVVVVGVGVDVVGPWTVVVASSGSVAAVSGTVNAPAGLGALRARPLVAARLQRGQPGRHAGRRQEEPPARPAVAAGVVVGRRSGPAHRLGAQVVERRRQVLAVRARPQLQRQPGIVVGSVHRPTHHASTPGVGAGSADRRAGRRSAAAGSPAVTSVSPTRMAS